MLWDNSKGLQYLFWALFYVVPINILDCVKLLDAILKYQVKLHLNSDAIIG